MRSEPCTDPVVMRTPGYGGFNRAPVYGSFAPGSGANHVAADQRAVAVRVGDGDAQAAAAGPAAAQRVAAVPAREDVARRQREPRRGAHLLRELGDGDLAVLLGQRPV